MYLFIDSSQKDNIHLALFDADTFVEKNVEASNRELLASIDAFFGEQNIRITNDTNIRITPPKADPPWAGKLRNIKMEGIMVVVGAGGFTSTRIAVTVANTFGYVLQIPLLAISVEQIDHVQDLIPELLKQPKGQYISAKYSGEPSISMGKG